MAGASNPGGPAVVYTPLRGSRQALRLYPQRWFGCLLVVGDR